MAEKSEGGILGVIIFLLVAMTIWYSLAGVFERSTEPTTAFEVFILEAGFAATSGFVAPVNAYFRNSEDGNLSEYGYKADIERYAEVYNEGLNKHPFALIFGDVFGSVFSALSAMAFFFAVRSSESMGAFKMMFWTEVVEESLYYINVHRMTGDVDLTLIDVGVSLVIAVIVGSFAEFSRKK